MKNKDLYIVPCMFCGEDYFLIKKTKNKAVLFGKCLKCNSNIFFPKEKRKEILSAISCAKKREGEHSFARKETEERKFTCPFCSNKYTAKICKNAQRPILFLRCQECMYKGFCAPSRFHMIEYFKEKG